MKDRHNCYACGQPCDCGETTTADCLKCEACVEVDWGYEDNFDEDWGV